MACAGTMENARETTVMGIKADIIAQDAGESRRRANNPMGGQNHGSFGKVGENDNIKASGNGWQDAVEEETARKRGKRGYSGSVEDNLCDGIPSKRRTSS